MRAGFLVHSAGVLLLFGCATTEPPEAGVANPDTMLHLGSTLRPEELLFPEYLLMMDFEIDQHGRIPESAIVGADLRTKLDIETARQRFLDVLASHRWNITQQEIAEHSFRLQAAAEDASLEIRAVQGSGSTRVFLLYRPGPGPLL